MSLDLGRSSKDLTSVIECIGVEALNWIPLIMFVAEEIGEGAK